MILNQIHRDVKTVGVSQSTKMQLSASEEVQDHIIKLLTENGYKRPIPSLVREVFCNGLDGSVANNTPDNPVLVRLYRNELANWIFEVRDEGIGMSKEDFYKYCMNIGESTKRSSNNMIGAMGAGFKSPLAYCQGFETITRKDGIENKFYIYKGASRPEVTEISSTPTTDINGVTVRIPVDRWDVVYFKEAIKEQLAYFPTAVIHIEDENFDYLNAKVFQHELFEWSEIYPHYEMHISFAGVNYPLDWTALEIPRINLPIAVKIGLHENVCPIFNRESLIYTTETKQLLMSKITNIADYFVNRFNEENQELITAKQAYEFHHKLPKKVELAGQEFIIDDLVPRTSPDVEIVTPTVKNVKLLSISEISNLYDNYLLFNYKVVSGIENDRFNAKYGIFNKQVLNWINQDKMVIYLDEPLKNDKREYLKSLKKQIAFVQKGKMELGFYSAKRKHFNSKYSFVAMLNLINHPKNQWRTRIEDYLHLSKHYEDKIISLSSIKITDEWKQLQKKKREAKKVNGGIKRAAGEITFKFATRLEKYSSTRNCKFEPKVFAMEKMHQRKELLIYGLEEDRYKLDNLYVLTSRSPERISIAIVGQRDYETLKKLKIHNLMTIQEFESGFNKPIARFVTAFKANNFLKAHPVLKENSDFIVDNISKDLGKAIERLTEYVNKYSIRDNELLSSLTEFCDKHKYYDTEMYLLLQELELQAPKLDFLKFLAYKSWHYSGSLPKECKDFVQEVLKSRKFRMDWQHYNLPEKKEANADSTEEN